MTTMRISADNLNAFMERLCQEAPDYRKRWPGDVRRMTYREFTYLLERIYLPKDYTVEYDDYLFPLKSIPSEFRGYATLE